MQKLLSVLLLLAPAAEAADPATSPYRGEQARAIKALAPSEVQDYLAGAGMGLAKAAELNRYPGPRHVLELAEPLALDSEQRARTQAIYERMQHAAVQLGERIVAQERALDALFAHGAMDERRLRVLTREIAARQGELRFVHLQAHLALRAVLRPEQIAHYDRLRGYAASDTDAPAPHSHVH
jgi:Spy/CpxP family protein refolding chaperone